MTRTGSWWLASCLVWSVGCGGGPATPPAPVSPPAAEPAAGARRGTYLLPFARARTEGDESVTEHSVVASGKAEDATVFAVWVAGPPGERWTATCSTDDAGYHGRIDRPAADGVPFRIETADGRTGAATVGGWRYKLADGRLFLVALRAEGFEVRQLDRPLPDRAAAEEVFGRLRGEPEVKEFFAGTGFLQRQKRGGN